MKILVNAIISSGEHCVHSIEEAFTYARQHEGEVLEVELAKGVYRQNRPIEIPQDLKFNQIIISGENCENTMISGSVLVDKNWEKYNDQIYVCDVGCDLDIDMLYVNDEIYHMARYPKYDENIQILQGCAKDCISDERIKGWDNPTNGYFHVAHSHRWGDFHYKIEGKDEDGKLILTGGTQNNRRMGLHEEHRYVEHIFEELTAPKEWFYNREEGKLFVIFDEGIDVKGVKVEAVINENLLKVVGTQDKPLKQVIIRNLTFTHTKRTFMQVKEPLLRSDWCIYRGGALYFNNAEQCVVENCNLVNLGSNAIFVDGNNKHISIRSNKINDIHGNGVCFVGDTSSVRSPLFEYHERQSIEDIDKEVGPKNDCYPKACEVIDCLITRTGRVEKQTAAIQVSIASRIKISHCSIYGVPRAAINFSEGNFGGHIIEHCDIFDTVLETGDHGSFNSWGRDRFWGLKGIGEDELGGTDIPFLDAIETNTIRNNRVRCDYGWDIDLDDGSSNYEIYNNLCLNGGIKLREGFGRKVYNNIMVNNSMHVHVWYKNSGDSIFNNIMFSKYSPIGMDVEWGAVVDCNILHSSNEGVEVQPAAYLSQDSLKDGQSIMCNCMFKDTQAGDYTVQNKHVLAKGFKNFSMINFGVMSPHLKEEAKTPVLPTINALKVRKDQGVTFTFDSVDYKNIESMEEASAYGIGSKEGEYFEGVIMLNVPPFTGMFSRGMRTGDVILAINNQKIMNIEELKNNQVYLSESNKHSFVILRDQCEVEL